MNQVESAIGFVFVSFTREKLLNAGGATYTAVVSIREPSAAAEDAAAGVRPAAALAATDDEMSSRLVEEELRMDELK